VKVIESPPRSLVAAYSRIEPVADCDRGRATKVPLLSTGDEVTR
jgi:hypothetical protein